MSFFRWRGDAGRGSQPARARTSGRSFNVFENAQADTSDVAGPLAKLCNSEDAHVFIKPFASTFTYLRGVEQGFTKQQQRLRQELCEHLQVAREFLALCEKPTRRLDFVLTAHTDDRTARRFFQGVERAIVGAAADAPGVAEVYVSQWRQESETFFQRCREAWEIHFYFVFLDIKGDKVLFEQTTTRLARLLGCSIRSLVSCFEYTKPWVDDALRSIAAQDKQPLLERIHAETLRQWRVAWGERTELPEHMNRFSEDVHVQGHKFWESYFTHLFRITWPDFAEAFEHYYLFGQFPIDVMQQLGLRVNPKGDHRVSRISWQRLLKENNTIGDLLDALVAAVLEDVGSMIYRPEPLKSLVTQQSTPADEDGAATEAPNGIEKPKRWFPFSHVASEDGDMAIPTPHDLRMRQGLSAELGSTASGTRRQPTMPWDVFTARLCTQSAPWWGRVGEEPVLAETESGEPTRLAAVRAVNGSIAYTCRALIFRVVSGDLAQNMPVLEPPNRSGSTASSAGETETTLQPALVITGNGTRFAGVTKFGRSSSRRTLLPDCPMGEPIASRSHFNVVYKQETDSYYLMDAGSKWGTFVKIGQKMTLSCGDWIRVGGVEFIVRYCGGGCGCKRKHAHYGLHSLRLIRDHQAKTTCKPGLWPPSHAMSSSCEMLSAADKSELARRTASFDNLCSARHVETSRLRSAKSSPQLTDRYDDADVAGGGSDDGAEESEDDCLATTHFDEWLRLLSSSRARGWTATSARLCQQVAMQSVGVSSNYETLVESSGEQQESLSRGGKLKTETQRKSRETSQSSVPISPLELDFISGPRMGEKLVLDERVCTLGRGETNSIQVTDSQLASVSRVHCIFEYSGDRWEMRDNGSTNGTWRRLSCVLEPSSAILLTGGISIQAGLHEFHVEEAEMRHWWLPCAARASFEELIEQESRGITLPQPVGGDVAASSPTAP
eukprot:TRINITY_DN22280_c0_g1_i1.p1 TRINITY_DN22280_c0_g1~~TRINITY_DN22280_c0_g1_i1.p1  ORF type:complete len:951 (-),score=145.51 TRINITY_DN22280_c0_g1_i1:96-2948(-)